MKRRIVRSFTVLLFSLFGLAVSRPATAQSFKVVKVQGGFALNQISSGGASVWALAPNGHPYIYKGTQFVLASSAVSLSQISAGGGSLRQSDKPLGGIKSLTVHKRLCAGDRERHTRMESALELCELGATLGLSRGPETGLWEVSPGRRRAMFAS